MMDESGINPKNSEKQNQKGTENAISEITGGRNLKTAMEKRPETTENSDRFDA